jgi:hypothetical protein
MVHNKDEYLHKPFQVPFEKSGLWLVLRVRIRRIRKDLRKESRTQKLSMYLTKPHCF